MLSSILASQFSPPPIQNPRQILRINLSETQALVPVRSQHRRKEGRAEMAREGVCWVYDGPAGYLLGRWWEQHGDPILAPLPFQQRETHSKGQTGRAARYLESAYIKEKGMVEGGEGDLAAGGHSNFKASAQGRPGEEVTFRTRCRGGGAGHIDNKERGAPTR